jgi:hypothetical protein
MSAGASSTAAALEIERRPGALPARYQAVIALSGVVVLGVALGSSPLSSHEVFVAGPAAQMLRNGDWVVPLLGDVPLLDELPLPAWIAATMMAVLGTGNEVAVRRRSTGVLCAPLDGSGLRPYPGGGAPGVILRAAIHPGAGRHTPSLPADPAGTGRGSAREVAAARALCAR